MNILFRIKNWLFRPRTPQTLKTSYSSWKIVKAYVVNDTVIFMKRVYKCTVAHTSARTITPKNDKTHWLLIGR
jgi:hypothetical protein